MSARKTTLIFLGATALAGCSPREPVPSGPKHPANPCAAEAPLDAPAPARPAEEPQRPAETPAPEPDHDHGGHDHGPSD